MVSKGATGAVLALVALGVAASLVPKLLENSTHFYMPPPSFKAIGPALQPYPCATEEGAYERNNHLHAAKKLFAGEVWGSESVAVGPDGLLYMLDRYGTVLRAKAGAGAQLERIAQLGAGRPLGFHFDAEGDLIICNAGNGLQKLEMKTKKVVLLASEAPVDVLGSKTSPIRYANDLAIASDGSVYFTDSTEIPPALNEFGFYDTMRSFALTMVQGDRTGRLLKYDPSTGQTSLLASNFWFSNGVALAKDESFVLVVETCTLTIHRIWLKGPRAGDRDSFISSIPGYPDGITTASDGTFWLALVSKSQPKLEAALKTRFGRWVTTVTPASWKKLSPGTGVVQLSEEGEVLRYLADDGTHLNSVSALTETPEGYFIGNLGGNFVSFLSKSSLTPLTVAAKR